MSDLTTYLGAKSESEWLENGRAIALYDNGMQFAIGDWINEGCDKKWMHGKYDEALGVFPQRSYKYLKDLAYVAIAIKRSDRSDLLPWSHHNRVTKLPAEQQRIMLRRCLEEDLTVKELIQLVSGPAPVIIETDVIRPTGITRDGERVKTMCAQLAGLADGLNSIKWNRVSIRVASSTHKQYVESRKLIYGAIREIEHISLLEGGPDGETE